MAPVSRLMLSIMCLISKLKRDRIRCFHLGCGHAKTFSNSFCLLKACLFWLLKTLLVLSFCGCFQYYCNVVQLYLWQITQQHEGDHPAPPGTVDLPFGHVTTLWFTSCRSGITERTHEPCHQSAIKTIYKQHTDVWFALKRKQVVHIVLD